MRLKPLFDLPAETYADDLPPLPRLCFLAVSLPLLAAMVALWVGGTAAELAGGAE